MRDNFTELIKAAAGELPSVSPDLERRVMIEIAHRAIERSRMRARRGMLASLAGVAMLFAGCIAALVAWYPALLPALTRFRWLESVRIPKPAFLDAAAASETAALSFFEQWGGLVLILLLIGGAVGFIYYLNSLFSSDYTPD